MWDAVVASTIWSVFFCAWNQRYWPQAAFFWGFFFDHEALDCCKRIFCGIPGCYTGSPGLGALWQLPQLRTCLCRIPVPLHLSRSRACVNLERASCWQERNVHAIPTQAPQNHKSSPFKVPFTTRMSSLLLHGELGLLTKKKKKLREKPELATDWASWVNVHGNRKKDLWYSEREHHRLWGHADNALRCFMNAYELWHGCLFYSRNPYLFHGTAPPDSMNIRAGTPFTNWQTTQTPSTFRMFCYSYLLFNKCFFQLLCCLLSHTQHMLYHIFLPGGQFIVIWGFFSPCLP